MPFGIKGIIAKNSHLLVTIMGIVLFSGILAWRYAAPERASTPSTVTWIGDYLGPATADETPLPFAESVIWHRPEQPYLSMRLLATDADKTLDFVNGVPVWWDIAPTLREDNSYHLVWRNDDGGLWRTLIDPNGNAMLTSIEVAQSVQKAAIATSGDGRAVVAWISDGVLSLTVIDVFGRPLIQWDAVAQNVDEVALFPSPSPQTYLAWVQSARLYTAIIDDLNQQPSPIGFDLPISSTEWVERVHLIGVDSTTPDVLWFVHDIARPDVGVLWTMSWSGDAMMPDEGFQPDAIGIAHSPQPSYRLATLTVADNEQATWLRWADRIPQAIAGPPLALSAPRMWFDRQGALRSAAWIAVDDGRYYQYITYPQLNTSTILNPTTRQWLKDGLEHVYLAIGWLLLPLFLSVSGYAMRQQIPPMVAFGATMISYFALKLLLSPSELYHLPPMLDSDALVGVFAVLVGIGGISATVSSLWTYPTHWQWTALFVATDAILTLIVLGGNLS